MTLRLRPYADGDWEAVLELCLLAFAPGCEALQDVVGSDLEWRGRIGGYLRSLARSREKARLVVAEMDGWVVGVVHYEVDRVARCGRIGISAVHPARQGRGIGPRMYEHVLEAMRARGLKYASAETGGDAGHARSRRAYEKVGFKAVPMVQYFKELGDARAGARPPRPGRGKRASPAATRRRRARQTQER